MPPPDPSAARHTAFAFAMRALGRSDPPTAFDLAGTRYRRTGIIKHDFWAATAFYVAEDGRRAVAKINRCEPFCGLGLEWIGRWLCRRETRFYAALRDVESVPALLGRIGSTGFIHDFVPGHALSSRDTVGDEFFAQLRALFDELHRRDIAYVDANKPQNILLGDDGRPHLIDFQISYDLHALGGGFLNRAILRKLQSADNYHLLKHKRKLRPDQLSAREVERVKRKSVLIRLHRWLTRPYFLIRRRAMRKLRESGQLLPEGSK